MICDEHQIDLFIALIGGCLAGLTIGGMISEMDEGDE